MRLQHRRGSRELTIPPTAASHKAPRHERGATRAGCSSSPSCDGLLQAGLFHVDVDRLVGHRGEQIVTRVAGVGAAVGLSMPDGDHSGMVQRSAPDAVDDHLVALRLELADRVLGAARAARCGDGGCGEPEERCGQPARDDSGKSKFLHFVTTSSSSSTHEPWYAYRGSGAFDRPTRGPFPTRSEVLNPQVKGLIPVAEIDRRMAEMSWAASPR